VAHSIATFLGYWAGKPFYQLTDVGGAAYVYQHIQHIFGPAGAAGKADKYDNSSGIFERRQGEKPLYSVAVVKANSLTTFSAGAADLQDLHKQLEAKISAFHGTDDTILYPSCFDANAGEVIASALLCCSCWQSWCRMESRC